MSMVLSLLIIFSDILNPSVRQSYIRMAIVGWCTKLFHIYFYLFLICDKTLNVY